LRTADDSAGDLRERQLSLQPKHNADLFGNEAINCTADICICPLNFLDCSASKNKYFFSEKFLYRIVAKSAYYLISMWERSIRIRQTHLAALHQRTRPNENF